MREKLAIIDAHALIHRAYHALPKFTTPSGEPSGAIYGFALVFLKMLKDINPNYIVACFDYPAPTFRHQAYKEYKATRVKAPDELYIQIPKIKEMLSAFGVPVLEKEGYEADDLLGAVAKEAKSKDKAVDIIIISGDLDTLQLVDERVKIYTLKKGLSDTIVYDKKAVMSRFGIEPKLLVDFKGLKGDPSDNIPGVRGIGEKTALSLIKKYGSLERIYENINKKDIKDTIRQKLKDQKEEAFFSRELASIREDLSIAFSLEKSKVRLDKSNALPLFKKWGFVSLIERLDGPQLKEVSKKKPSPDIEIAAWLLDPERANISTAFSDEASVKKNLMQRLKERNLEKVFKDIEIPLVAILKNMEVSGVKIDVLKLQELQKSFEHKIQSLNKEIVEIAGENFNPASTQQLSKILFEKLKISPKGMKKTEKGKVSTKESELVKIKNIHSIIAKILEFRELSKIKNTYIDGLLELTNKETQRVHTTFVQTGTSTGRLSSRDPNLQNIPIKTPEGRKIREVFVAEKGFKLVSADFSQIELRVAAILSKDPKMVNVFREGKDIHRTTAALVWNVPEKNVTDEMRSQAKVLNFGMIYGQSFAAFAQAAGISREQAQDFIKEYFKEFKKLRIFLERSKEKARQFGFLESLFGRRRYFKDINSANFKVRSAAERAAQNFPIQGSAADILKISMIKTFNSLEKKFGHPIVPTSPWRLILTVHDELIFEIRDDIIQEAQKIIKHEMESIYQNEVSLLVEIKAGDNWGSMKPIC